jgi:uncharacterized membrane protein YfcA
MDKMAALPIDWKNVNWDYLIALVILVFVCTFLGTALSLKRTFLGCVLTAVLFGTAFMFWTYYPHNLPLPTLATPQKNTPSATAQPPWLMHDQTVDSPARRY